MLSREMRKSEAEVQALVDQGFTEEAARQHLRAYYSDPLNRESDAIRSVAPVMEFLSPAGDVMAIAESIGQALDGNVAGGLLGGGLATASIFFPGRVQGDLISDDMLRTMALQNARQGLVEDQVPDIIEYIQEVATPGQISFGNTRSSALGGGQRVWTEPRFVQGQARDGSGTGYMRDFFDRPYSTNPSFSYAGTAADQPYQAGRSLGHVLGESGTNVSDSSLEQVRDIINRHLSNMNRNQALNSDQVDYYQGIIDAIGLDLPPAGQTRLTSGPRPFRRTRTAQTSSNPAVTTSRNRPASSGTGAAQAPQGKPDVEEIELGKLGDTTMNTYNINRADLGITLGHG